MHTCWGPGGRAGQGCRGHATFCPGQEAGLWPRSWPLPNQPQEPEAFRQMSDVIRPGWGPHGDADPCTLTSREWTEDKSNQGQVGRKEGPERGWAWGVSR